MKRLSVHLALTLTSTLLAGMVSAQSLTAQGMAELLAPENQQYGHEQCRDQVAHSVNCIAKFSPTLLNEFYEGATVEQLFAWNPDLPELLVDSDGDGTGDTVPASTHLLVQAPQTVEQESEPDYFANAREKCAQPGPHNCGTIGWKRPIDEFIESKFIPFPLFVRWNELPDEVSPATVLPEGATVVVYDPTDEEV